MVFVFFKFKSNWLNSVDSLKMELLYNDHLHFSGGKGLNYWEIHGDLFKIFIQGDGFLLLLLLFVIIIIIIIFSLDNAELQIPLLFLLFFLQFA